MPETIFRVYSVRHSRHRTEYHWNYIGITPAGDDILRWSVGIAGISVRIASEYLPFLGLGRDTGENNGGITQPEYHIPGISQELQ